jgi:hypothetical protein
LDPGARLLQAKRSGEYKNAVRVIAFNTFEGWSQDVSTDIAQELRRRCDLQMRDVPYNIHEFVEQHYGLDRQLSLRLIADEADRGVLCTAEWILARQTKLTDAKS